LGGKNLNNESKKYDRLYILLNKKPWYFDDVKTHNSFVRLRNEHLAKLGA